MDFNRLFHEKNFYLSILLALASILIGTAWPSIPPGTVLPSDISFSLLESALQSKAVLFALPVAAALPFGDAYLKERQWNYLRFLLIRQSRGTYCQSRILVTAVSGPLAWFFAACLALLFFFFNFFYPEICLYLAAGLSFFTACHVGKAFLMRLISIQPKCGVCCAWRLGLSGVRASIPALVQLYHPAGTISGITLLPGSFRVAFSTK